MIRHKIGCWASDRAFAYYKTQTDARGKTGSYLGLPRYFEVLVNWGYKRHNIRDSLRYRWVIRDEK